MQSIQADNLYNGMSRKYAWCLLLNVTGDLIKQSYRDLYYGLKSEIFNLAKSTVSDGTVRKQISLDVPRTFSRNEVAQFQQPVDS